MGVEYRVGPGLARLETLGVSLRRLITPPLSDCLPGDWLHWMSEWRHWCCSWVPGAQPGDALCGDRDSRTLALSCRRSFVRIAMW